MAEDTRKLKLRLRTWQRAFICIRSAVSLTTFSRVRRKRAREDKTMRIRLVCHLLAPSMIDRHRIAIFVRLVICYCTTRYVPTSSTARS